MYGLLLGFNFILFLHVFTHIAQSLYFRTYALGVCSAVLITLPYSVYLFYRLLEAGEVDVSMIVLSAPFVLLTIAAVLLGHKIAPRLIP